jgi:hypothetical protein
MQCFAFRPFWCVPSNRCCGFTVYFRGHTGSQVVAGCVAVSPHKSVNVCLQHCSISFLLGGILCGGRLTNRWSCGMTGIIVCSALLRHSIPAAGAVPWSLGGLLAARVGCWAEHVCRAHQIRSTLCESEDVLYAGYLEVVTNQVWCQPGWQ